MPQIEKFVSSDLAAKDNDPWIGMEESEFFREMIGVLVDSCPGLDQKKRNVLFQEVSRAKENERRRIEVERNIKHFNKIFPPMRESDLMRSDWDFFKMKWAVSESIGEIPRDMSGIYVISSGRKTLYVGQSQDIRKRLGGYRHPWRIAVANFPNPYILYTFTNNKERGVLLRLEDLTIKALEPEWNGNPRFLEGLDYVSGNSHPMMAKTSPIATAPEMLASGTLRLFSFTEQARSNKSEGFAA